MICVQLIIKKENKNYQYTEVRFFDTMESIDEGMKYIILSKIQDYKRMYEEQLQRLQEKLDIYQRQINIFEKICEDGNVLVSLDELTAIDVTKKLAIVEKDPRVLWKAFESVFGFGFFNPMIEEEFGITPAFKDTIQKQYNDELNKARHESLNKVNKFAGSIKQEIDTLRKTIWKKNGDISKVQTVFTQKLEKTVAEVKEMMELSFKNKFEIRSQHLLDSMYETETKAKELK